VRFASAITRKQWLDAGLWLTRRVKHPRLRRVEKIAPRCYVHHFRFEDPSEMNEDFCTIVREAYRISYQENLQQRVPSVKS
jgi:hypothetical protein